jgi:zinc D-Ala-D-Ala dipeptidase
VVVSPRYATEENFTGAVVEGYRTKRIVCTEACALALKKVNEMVSKDGFTLVVYDSFRPQRAVDSFLKWSLDQANQTKRETYYPRVKKSELFSSGYIAHRSGHSRGSTVDVTLLARGNIVCPVQCSFRKLTIAGDEFPFLDDNTLDMGTSFDLFDEVSHHDSPLISVDHLRMRNYLRQMMEANGFRALQDEWWHYTLVSEPFPETFFDFDII